jgi:hypothetical protein
MGHKAVLSGAVNSPFKSVAVTFSSIPFKTGGSIMTTADKERKLRDFGIDEVLMLDFFEIKDLSPAEFLELLGKKYNIGKICCGFNYRFGKNAKGDIAFLEEYCKDHGIPMEECSFRHMGCPKHHGYEVGNSCPKNCKDCWDREMPYEKSIEDTLIKDFTDDLIVFSDTIKMSKLWQRDIYNISIKNEKLRDLFMSFKENKIFYATDLCGTDFKQVIDFSIRR